jgi:hypothetical protein
MSRTRYSWLAVPAVCWIFLLQGSRAAEPAEKQDGPEVLARGPVHEAYAEPIEQQPGAGPAVPKEPPSPIDELPPDQKPAGDHVVWLPGYWSWDVDRKDFIWVSGFWRAQPPNRVWMPGSWRKSDAGFQWVAGFWAPAKEQAQVEYLPEPPAPLENGAATPAPSATSVYVPGAWVWRGTRYVWRPGYWMDYRPGWIWIPAHYRWTPAGYVFIDGYWDYALADRGILYAPTYIPSTVYLARGYYYTPTVVVREQCMYGALFVRRGYSCYYFGDYFEPRYATIGFTSWCGYSGGSEVVVVRGWYDPMYSYYRVTYRDEPSWQVNITAVYVGRYKGDVPPPPRTLVQQNNIFVNNTVVNNTTVINNKTVNVTNVQMLTTAPAAAKANPNLKLETLSTQARQEQRTSARQINEFAQQRGHTETQMVAKNGGVPKASEGPRTAKMDVPKTLTTRAAATPANLSGPRVDPKVTGTGGTGNHNTGTGTGTGTGNHNIGTGTGTGTGTANKIDPKTGLPVHDPMNSTGIGHLTDPKGSTILPKYDPKSSLPTGTQPKGGTPVKPKPKDKPEKN